ncbi:MAG TPA: PilZ domain-containing protein [Myxococcota bacterium]
MKNPSASGESERRQYKRVRAPVYCRPAGIALKFLSQKTKPLDISLGGMRIYADEPVKKGTKLELELFLPDNSSVTCRVEVVWIEDLPPGSPAKQDIGLKFIDIKTEDRARLAAVLDEP